MTVIDQALASLRSDAATPAKAKPPTAAKSGKRKKAAKGKSARQKANQSNRKASGASRKFKLASAALKELRAEGGKGFVNPYREGSSYHACAAALRKLGVGKLHAFNAIVTGVRKAMGSNYKAFAAKKGAMSADDRIVMNVSTVARDDYGKPLRKVGYEVRYDGREKVAGLFCLKRGK